MADNADGLAEQEDVADDQIPRDQLPPGADGVQGGAINDVVQILEWIGFTPNQAIRVQPELARNLKALMGLGRRSVENTADSFAKRTVADGRIIFGTSRTSAVLDAVRWAQDWQRLGTTPMLLPVTTRDSFLDELDEAGERDKARKSTLASADSRAKEASPGPLKGARIWETWFDKLQNQLSIMTGVLQEPLIYVIRDSVPHLVAAKANFHSLHSQLIYERKKLGIGGGGKGKSKSKAKRKWNGKRNTSSLSSKVPNQSTKIKRLDAKIASLSAEGGDGDADSPDDAGNRGRAEMAESKKKKRKTN